MTKNKLSSLELRLEYFKSKSNIQHKLLKAFYDGRPISERYLDGSVAIHVHLFASKDCLCVTAVNADYAGMSESGEMPMFVWVGKVAEKSRPVTSCVRLQPLEHCNVLSSESAEMPQISLELLLRIYNDKLGFLYDALGIKASQLIDKVFKSNPQIGYGVSNQPANSCWCGEIDRETSSTERNLTSLAPDIHNAHLILQGNVICHNFGEGANFRPEGVQVFPCPVNPLISAIEWMHRSNSTVLSALQSRINSNEP